MIWVDGTEICIILIRSLVDIAKTNSLTEQQETELIEGMFAAAGLEDKNVLTYEDFKLMMKEYKGDFIAIGLDCKGNLNLSYYKF